MHPHRPSAAVAPCAEFPNDNPALHSGAIWRCLDLNGAATWEPARAVAPALRSEAAVEPTHEVRPTEPTILAGNETHEPAAVEAEIARPGDDAADGCDIDVVDDLGFDEGIVEEALEACAAESMALGTDEGAEPCLAPAASDAAMADCAVADGAVADGAVADGAIADGAVADGAVADGAVAETSVPAESGVLESFTTDGTATDGALADDTVCDEEELPTDVDGPASVPSDDPFATLCVVLGEVARAMGCSAESLRCVGTLLGVARVDGSTLSAASADALVSGGLLESGEQGYRRAEGFAREVLAWQGVLRGECDDFSACGAAMLDEWCANLLARAMGNPSRAETLRRELRRRGVAAFGLVADAA